MSHTILREKVKIGSKGQAVIPVAMRKIMGIVPGTELLLEMDDQRNIRVKMPDEGEDPIAVFRRIARSGKPLTGKLDMNALHDEEMEDRFNQLER